MADVHILRSAVTSVPLNYTLPDTAEFRLKAVYAEFDDNGAASDWLPTVTILDDSGHEIARACEQEVKVTSGDDADVSWFPRVRRKRAATSDGLSCQLLGSGNGTTTLVLTLTQPVPANGNLFAICSQVSAPDGVDGGSEISGVIDSGGGGPWRRSFSPNNAPIITNIRQTDAGNAFSLQVSSAGRACVAADLGVGSTVTVSFSSVAPANFHTAGLLVWQPAYFLPTNLSGFASYGNGDAHPDSGASLTEMSWDDDYGPMFYPAQRDSQRIAAMGAYPAVAGFAPFSGAKIGEIASGSVSIAATCLQVCEGTFPDPGGTWPAGAQALAGSFQYAQPRLCLTT